MNFITFGSILHFRPAKRSKTVGRSSEEAKEEEENVFSNRLMIWSNSSIHERLSSFEEQGRVEDLHKYGKCLKNIYCKGFAYPSFLQYKISSTSHSLSLSRSALPYSVTHIDECVRVVAGLTVSPNDTSINVWTVKPNANDYSASWVAAV